MFEKLVALFFDTLSKARWLPKYQMFRQKYDLAQSFRFNGEGILFYGNGKIVIGENSYIGRHSSIQSSAGCIVKIGKNCALSHYIMVYTENRVPNQDFGKAKLLIRKGNVIIGDNCWVGAHVFIREGVTIGDNVVVGANSVVTKDIPSFTIAAGCPAKIIKKIVH